MPSQFPLRLSFAGLFLGLTLVACSEFVLREPKDTAIPSIQVTETFQQASSPRVDLLLVVDNTASMSTARTALTEASGTLLASLEAGALSWQIGVTTTDIEGSTRGELHGDPWILTPATPSPAEALARALDVPEGLAPTGGLGAATLALTEPHRSGANRGLRRPDAALHIIVISDADDESSDILGVSPADAFLELLDDEADGTGEPARLSAVVGAPGTGCTGTAGTALPGDIYALVAEQSGGAVASICEPELGMVVSQLGTRVQTGEQRFELQELPEPDSLRVEVEGVRVDEGWALVIEDSVSAVHFDEAPAPGVTISVRYTLATSETSG